MEELMIGGIAMVPVIVALVELAKKWFKLPTEWAPLLNGALSVLVYAVMVAGQIDTSFNGIAVMVVHAILYFLAGAGVYKASKPTVKKIFRT